MNYIKRLEFQKINRLELLLIRDHLLVWKLVRHSGPVMSQNIYFPALLLNQIIKFRRIFNHPQICLTQKFYLVKKFFDLKKDKKKSEIEKSLIKVLNRSILLFIIIS
ncbi:hypothetical protein BpHYR1_009912 [Brachionus plicatilis]|uniref:Uncharacterized protein n=1 Tax=Brachionus plicatilis TaxID=10195 RepID=A0A3M7REV6_BRAPC|nr:hypothetical protein BpHYR1_009912 [Brachionus plicatilis]